MAVEKAREILRLDQEARDDGTIGNEDTSTIAHALLLATTTAGSA